MRYNKLVRDKIPEYIKHKGGTPVSHVAEEGEYWEKLKEKLGEEVREFLEDESLEEFGDLQEVVDAVAEYKRFSPEAVKAVRDKKAEERGRFKDRIILDEVRDEKDIQSR